MELLVEFILELLVEGTIELLPNKKVPKWVRYPLAAIIILAIIAVIGLVFFCGVLALKENILFAILLFILGIIFVFGFINKFIEVKKKIQKNENE